MNDKNFSKLINTAVGAFLVISLISTLLVSIKIAELRTEYRILKEKYDLLFDNVVIVEKSTETETEDETTKETEVETETETESVTETTTETETEKVVETTKSVKVTSTKGPHSKADSDPVEPSYFKARGVIYLNGWRFTYYSEKVLPGLKLKIPGRHSDGTFVRDAEENICVASSDLKWGTYIETPFGMGRVYDGGCAKGTIDIYVSW